MLQAYKYRIYPTDEQKVLFAKTFGCCRFVYNWALNTKVEAYKEDKRSIPYKEIQDRMVNELKKEHEWLSEVNSQSLLNSIRNLDTAYKGNTTPNAHAFRHELLTTLITGILLLCFAPAHSLGQTREELDYIADSLLQTATHEQRALGIIQAIDWESNIIEEIPSLSPVLASNLSRINISSNFGSRFHPIYQRSHHHSGIDIPPPPGNDTIYAPANGIIDTIGYDNRLGYFIRIHHKYGYQTTYGHLRRVLASISGPILIGEPIALIGNTGASTGPHLHYSIKYRGKLVNPLPYCYLMYDYLLQLEQ